jgi:hypothetical protein
MGVNVMWLITIIMQDGRKARKVFSRMNEAKQFCDYCTQCGLQVWECVIVGTEISRKLLSRG